MLVVVKKYYDAYHLIVLSSMAVGLALTPWINVDSLIVPKVIILFCTALYLLPLIILNLDFLLSNKITRVLIILILLMVIQMVLVIINSPAPLEQQIFGKGGRGLGFLVEISLLIFTATAAQFVNMDKTKFFIAVIVVTATISSTYSILQRFGLDIFAWYTRTNGIIGTVGNPNFQSTLAALAFVPSVFIFIKGKKLIRGLSIFVVLTLCYTIYICQSAQGYVVSILTLCVVIVSWVWYKNRILFFATMVLIVSTGVIALLGIINKGPLSSNLYDVSIQSRGEFFRTAFAGALDNPFFGVGLDSFGDVSTYYKSIQDARGVNEFTDNAHNYFLNYAVNGGFILALLYLGLIILTFYCFIRLHKNYGKFNLNLMTIFGVWIGFQAQSLISPNAIPLLVFGSILSGSLIGLYATQLTAQSRKNKESLLYRPFSMFLLLVGLIFMYPYFNVDRLQLKSLNTRDALLAVKSAKSFPESSLRYQRIGNALLSSNLGEQALEVGRSAVEFNPKSVTAWALILANSNAKKEERIEAANMILKLDPFNDEVSKIKVLLSNN